MATVEYKKRFFLPDTVLSTQAEAPGCLASLSCSFVRSFIHDLLIPCDCRLNLAPARMELTPSQGQSRVGSPAGVTYKPISVLCEALSGVPRHKVRPLCHMARPLFWVQGSLVGILPEAPVL